MFEIKFYYCQIETKRLIIRSVTNAGFHDYKRSSTFFSVSVEPLLGRQYLLAFGAFEFSRMKFHVYFEIMLSVKFFGANVTLKRLICVIS